MKLKLLLFKSFLCILILLAIVQKSNAQTNCWNLVWNDEFNVSQLDSNKWTPEVFPPKYNGELQYYTARSQNVSVLGGNLNITGLRESYNGSNYTSARINTKDKFYFNYGRVEARIKIPKTQGLWPSFWLLPQTGVWPESGEIDIVEILGHQPNVSYSTLHISDTTTNTHVSMGSAYTKPTGDFADGFHYFATEWHQDTIRFFVDSVLIATKTRSGFTPGVKYPFNSSEFYLILNLAIGGNWPGSPDNTTLFPANMQVDWVRVYQKNDDITLLGKDYMYVYTQNQPYTVPNINATAYTWTVPTGATIASGQNTHQIKINWGYITSSGWVKVQMNTPCGVLRDSIWVNVSDNLLSNHGFEQDFNYWNVNLSGNMATKYIDKNAPAHLLKAACVNETQVPVNAWDIQMSRSDVPLTSGALYTLKFWAKSNPPGRVITTSFMNSINYASYAYQWYLLTNNWAEYTYSFISPVTQNILMTVDMGAGTGTYCYDNFSLTKPLPLPVSLMSFTAKLHQKNNVTIDFSTASEQNNHYFNIEHGIDAINFDKIAQINGNGNSNTIQKYQFIHQDLQEGVHFYRLKQVDIDGTFKYSDVRKININKNNSVFGIETFPNPAKNILNINATIDENIDTFSITIYDTNGRIILAQNLSNTQNQIDMSNLNSGLYFAKIMINDEVTIRKISVLP